MRTPARGDLAKSFPFLSHDTSGNGMPVTGHAIFRVEFVKDVMLSPTLMTNFLSLTGISRPSALPTEGFLGSVKNVRKVTKFFSGYEDQNVSSKWLCI